MTKRVMVIDALNAYFRAYIVNPSLSKNGQPIGGYKGFLGILQKLCREMKPNSRSCSLISALLAGTLNLYLSLTPLDSTIRFICRIVLGGNSRIYIQCMERANNKL